jgi:hypothetical protein
VRTATAEAVSLLFAAIFEFFDGADARASDENFKNASVCGPPPPKGKMNVVIAIVTVFWEEKIIQRILKI